MANELTVFKGNAVTLPIEKQMELLKTKFHLPETAIERNYVRIDWVDDPDAKTPDCRRAVMKGSAEAKHKGQKPIYVLCKREHPISVFVNGSGKMCTTKSYGDRIFGKRESEMTRDETRMMMLDGFNSTVEVGEVQSAGCACL